MSKCRGYPKKNNADQCKDFFQLHASQKASFLAREVKDYTYDSFGDDPLDIMSNVERRSNTSLRKKNSQC